MRTVLDDTYLFRLSPNHSGRGGAAAELLVWHYTVGGSARSTADWLCREEARASYHFVIGRRGDVYQLVPLDKAAWHAGVSEWCRPSTGEVEGNLNRWTVGIGMANWGYLVRDEHGGFWHEIGGTLQAHDGPAAEATLWYDDGTWVHGWWEPYPEPQMQAAADLCERLTAEGYLMHQAGHEEVAMPFATRKRDPGPMFPHERVGPPRDDRRTWQEVA